MSYYRQTRKESLIETVINTAFGFLVSALAWPVVAIAAGYPYSFSHNMAITGFFTVLSVARGYVVRRFFETRFRNLAHRWATRFEVHNAETTQYDTNRQRGEEERPRVLGGDGLLPGRHSGGSPPVEGGERQAQPGAALALEPGQEHRPCGLHCSASPATWRKRLGWDFPFS